MRPITIHLLLEKQKKHTKAFAEIKKDSKSKQNSSVSLSCFLSTKSGNPKKTQEERRIESLRSSPEKRHSLGIVAAVKHLSKKMV